jgi:hypothetical protein
VTTVDFTPAKYRKLKEAYDKARLEGREKFLFEGQAIVTDYAKYMLEYLERVLNVAR